MAPETLLFPLIQTVICGQKLDSEISAACTEAALEEVYKLAAAHDLAHLVGQAVSRPEFPEGETVKKCKQAAMGAFVRQMRQEQAFARVSKAFEGAKIPFIPLKGQVLRSAYPEPWMRTSSDLDILVREADLTRGTELLIQSLGYRYHKQSSHDVALVSPEKVYLELHYSTIEDFISKDAHRVMETVWEQAIPVTGSVYQLQMPDPLFYYYHMAHAAKHFVGGGCGIRAVLDTWILENRVEHSREKRETLLEKGGMLTFARGMEKLSRIWFEKESHDALSQAMETFILTGGNFGTLENRVSMNQTRKGGKCRYALSRIFLPYHTLKHQYPILQKYKILFPIFQVVRWCKLLFRGGADRGVRELQTHAAITPQQLSTASQLLDYLNLRS